MEYYIDYDPGLENALPVSAVDGAFDSKFEEWIIPNIQTGSLLPGRHTLYVRAKDTFGNWGSPIRVEFDVFENRQISSAEFFINQDPGVGNGSPLILANSDRTFRKKITSANISTSNLSEGIHELGIRVFDNTGKYIFQKTTFSVWEQKISKVEYMVTTHLVENSTWYSNVFPTDGAFDESQENFQTESINYWDLPESDKYYVHIRSIDNFNLKSEPEIVSVEVLDTTGTPNPTLTFTPTPSPTSTSTQTPEPTFTPTPTPTSKPSDINKDGFINGLDLILFQQDWHRGWRDR